MALVGRRDGRNFGCGRQLSYAGRQALEDLFAGGHFATVKAYSDRWQAFVRWCRSEDGPGYNDARQIDRQTLDDYVAYLRQQILQGELCITTAQKRLSSVNRTLAALRGDLDVRIVSPSQALGQQRSIVRTRAPDGQDYQNVQRVAQVLAQQQHERVAAIVMLARTTGMRLREAILADLPRLHREAEHLGRINIQDGTKGGRSGASAPRWVIANEEVKAALQLAREASPTGSRNLLFRDETYALFMQRTVLPARATLHEYGLKGFHELRAAYACKRYEQLTVLAAPINGGDGCRTDRDLDHQARLQISLELGHNRIDRCGFGLHWWTIMSKPFDMTLFLSGTLAGSRTTQQRHLRQARIMQAAIQQRWHRNNPWDLAAKACALVSYPLPERSFRRQQVSLSSHCCIDLEAQGSHRALTSY